MSEPMWMRLLLVATCASAPLLVGPAGCNDGESFDKGQFPRLQVVVDGTTLDEDEGGEVSFGQALQLSVTKEVQLINPGFEDVTITAIEWALGTDGLPQKNPYVDYEGLDKIAPGGFPTTVADGDVVGKTFRVRFTPPLEGALDNFDASVLRIASNARTKDGSKAIPEVFVTFTMPSTFADAQVNPAKFTYNNATPTKPDTQQFCVENSEAATASFEVKSITPQTTCSEFKLTDVPNLPATVLEPSHPQYEKLCFEITYHPVDAGDDECNWVVVIKAGDNEVSLILALKSDLLFGSYSLSCSHDGDGPFDFTNANPNECHECNLYSEGPGPITVFEPFVDPPDAETWYQVKVYKPATDPEGEDTEVTSWPLGQKMGKSLLFEVCYTPLPTPGLEPPNGVLTIPVDKPDRVDVELDLLAGVPKPKIDVAPVTHNVFVTASFAEAETGTRHVVLYNHGNGTLDVSGIALTKGSFGRPAVAFSFVSEPVLPLAIPPNGLHVLEIAWDSTKATDPEGHSESLSITYHDPYFAKDVPLPVQLVLADTGENTKPTAIPQIVGEPVAGGDVVLTAYDSIEGSFGFSDNTFLWYLLEKPEGSNAKLNIESGQFATFVADVEGSYRVELVAYALQGSGILFSDPVEITVDVGPAPAPEPEE